MRLILLDTNFWLMPFENGLDLIGQLERLSEDAPFEIGVPTSVKAELDAMASSPPSARRSRSARSALRVMDSMLKSGKAKLLPSSGPADGSLITLALQTGAWVGTNDRALRYRLKAKKVKVILLRDDHVLAAV